MDLSAVWNTIAVICGGIAVLGGATAVIGRWLRPIKDAMNKKADKEDLEELKQKNKQLHEILHLILAVDVTLLEHAITNNSTGKMQALYDKVKDYCIDRV